MMLTVSVSARPGPREVDAHRQRSGAPSGFGVRVLRDPTEMPVAMVGAWVLVPALTGLAWADVRCVQSGRARPSRLAARRTGAAEAHPTEIGKPSPSGLHHRHRMDRGNTIDGNAREADSLDFVMHEHPLRGREFPMSAG